jgi:hypothetical protein
MFCRTIGSCTSRNSRVLRASSDLRSTFWRTYTSAISFTWRLMLSGSAPSTLIERMPDQSPRSDTLSLACRDSIALMRESRITQ